ncbi:unnamed protein product [Rhizophagus irregularis]|nr:unnamed protein product [Rhizophagus irregularis]
MNFITFARDYREIFPNATPEEVNIAFRISDEYQELEQRLSKVETQHEQNDQRLSKVETQLKKANSVLISGIDSVNMQQIKDSLGLRFKVVDWTPIQMNVTVMQACKFTWSSLAEDAQCERYLKHLEDVISLPNSLEWYNAKKSQQFLSLTNQTWLPFNLKGTTDIAILKKGYSSRFGQEVNGCIMTIELKKPKYIDSNARFQTQIQLIAANHWSNYDVIAILTDLNDSWEFFWEDEKDICSYKPDSLEVALKILQQLVNTEVNYIGEDSNTVDRLDNDGPPMKRRKKLDTFNVQTNDIANFNDFADIMPDMELKSKLIERYLREVFLPSTQYEQLETRTETSYYV